MFRSMTSKLFVYKSCFKLFSSPKLYSTIATSSAYSNIIVPKSYFQIPYRIERVLSKDYDAILNILNTTFIKEDPLCVSLNVKAENNKILNALWLDELKHGLSLKVIDKTSDNNEIVGVCVNVVKSPWSCAALDQLAEHKACDSNTKKLLEIWSTIGCRDKFHMQYNIPVLYEMSLLCVNKNHQGKDIAKKLIKTSLQNALDQGYDLAVIECTNAYSALAAKRNGMKTENILPLSVHFPTIKFIEPNAHILVANFRDGSMQVFN